MKFLATAVVAAIALGVPASAQPTGAGAPSILYGFTGRDNAAAPHGILSGSRSINVFSAATYGTKQDDSTLDSAVIYRSSKSTGLMTDVATPEGTAGGTDSARHNDTSRQDGIAENNTTNSHNSATSAPALGGTVAAGSTVGSSNANDTTTSAAAADGPQR